MKIPLQARSNGDRLDVVRNGKRENVDAPFLPYVLAPVDSSIDESDMIESYQLFNDDKVELYRLQRNTILEHETLRKKHINTKSFSMDHMSEIFVDEPDFFLGFPNNADLKILYFDIEVLSTGNGLFPRASSSPIIGIGCRINDGDVVIFDGVDRKTSDKQIIEDFLRFIEDHDPDVVVTYNGWTFDIPYILKRAEKHRIPVDSLGRWPTDQDPFWGRLNYDVYHDVKVDQAPQLLNLKNRKMETIYHHFTGKIAESIDPTNTGKYLISGEEGVKIMDPIIRKYLVSDVKATAAIFNVYFQGTVALAEFLGVPLASVVGVSNSFIPKIYYTRGLKSMNYMALDSNLDRYPDFPGKFEAAIVRINHRCPTCLGVLHQETCLKCNKDIEEKFKVKAGRFEKVHKMDFAAYYASALITFNLSPETTKFVRDYEYDESIYPLKIDRKGDKVILHIPDRKYDRTIVMEVDQSREGFLKRELLKLRTARAAIKKQMKGLNEHTSKYKILDSQQNIYKLLGNKCYGYNGLKYANFGDMMVAIGIVGICRWLTLKVDEWLRNRIVEIDTDGFIIHDWEDGMEDKTTEHLNALIKEKSGIEDSFILLEHDEMGEAFFYKMKSYVVRLPGGEIIKHGAALKSSRHPKIFDKAINTIIPLILDGEEVDWFIVVNEIKDFSNSTIDDFIMRCRMIKRLEEYETDSVVSVRLASQVLEDTKREAQPGDQMEFVVTKGKQYTLRSRVKSVKEIDRQYYESEINKALEIFDVPTNPAQLSLF